MVKRRVERTEQVDEYVCDVCGKVFRYCVRCDGCGKDLCDVCRVVCTEDLWTGEEADLPELMCSACMERGKFLALRAKAVTSLAKQELKELREQWKQACVSSQGERPKIKYSYEQLVDILAKIMYYGRSHYDQTACEDPDFDVDAFEVAMEPLSMAVACWLNEYTSHSGGVEWNVVHRDLYQSPCGVPEEVFAQIAAQKIALYGGLK